MSAAALAWYLIRTKPGKEQYLHRELSRRLPETFMPMLETRSRRLRGSDGGFAGAH
jgi:hypothetical protein